MDPVFSLINWLHPINGHAVAFWKAVLSHVHDIQWWRHDGLFAVFPLLCFYASSRQVPIYELLQWFRSQRHVEPCKPPDMVSRKWCHLDCRTCLNSSSYALSIEILGRQLQQTWIRKCQVCYGKSPLSILILLDSCNWYHPGRILWIENVTGKISIALESCCDWHMMVCLVYIQFHVFMRHHSMVIHAGQWFAMPSLGRQPRCFACGIWVYPIRNDPCRSPLCVGITPTRFCMIHVSIYVTLIQPLCGLLQVTWCMGSTWYRAGICMTTPSLVPFHRACPAFRTWLIGNQRCCEMQSYIHI